MFLFLFVNMEFVKVVKTVVTEVLNVVGNVTWFSNEIHVGEEAWRSKWQCC